MYFFFLTSIAIPLHHLQNQVYILTVKSLLVTQLPTPTPQFAFFVNLPQYIKEPYRRFLENNIRDHWDFSGVPMQIYFRQK